jgi:hypothetical protein
VRLATRAFSTQPPADSKATSTAQDSKPKLNADGTEEWQQYEDKESPTGFRYRNVHTRETSTEAPAWFIPHDKIESPLVRFFRTDTTAERGDPIPRRYWYTLAGVFTALLAYDYSQGRYQFGEPDDTPDLGVKTVTKRILKKRPKNEE